MLFRSREELAREDHRTRSRQGTFDGLASPLARMLLTCLCRVRHCRSSPRFWIRRITCTSCRGSCRTRRPTRGRSRCAQSTSARSYVNDTLSRAVSRLTGYVPNLSTKHSMLPLTGGSVPYFPCPVACAGASPPRDGRGCQGRGGRGQCGRSLIGIGDAEVR